MEFVSRGLLRVIRMTRPWFHILVAIVLMVCELAVRPAAGSVSPVATAVPDAQIDQELALIKDQLFNNKDAATRLSAASVLLFKEDAVARQLLLDVLKQSENSAAKAAVCKALDRARMDPRPLKNKEDFLPPLIGILGAEEDPAVAQSAAAATLMFTYDQVQSGLERIAGDSQLPVKIRSNAIYALQLHPDKRATLALIALVDSPDAEVSRAAGSALASLGISLPGDAEARRRAIEAIQQQSTEAYLRKRLMRSESDIRDLKASVQSWQDYYFLALTNWYASLGDDAARSTFLAERLKTAEPAIRLWALDRLAELKKGTGKPKLSEDLEKTLLSLVSSKNRQVRLKTATVLSLLWELNSTQKLLQQLQVEDDPEVRQELFVALGGACYYASLPTSPFKIPDDVRKATLEWAVQFLGEQSPDKVRNGAKVIRQQLEQDGLKADDIDKYLKALSRRYQEASAAADHPLRGELLTAMAGLCAQRSTCRPQAMKLYSPIFEQAIGDAANEVRLAAVEGFVNIEKAAALKRLQKALADDPFPPIRAKLIDLAGEVGGPEDLNWLSKKIGVAGEGDLAWAAMLKIFRGCGTDVLATWITTLASSPLLEKLSAEQRTAFYTLVEQRAQTDSKVDLLREARRRLAYLHTTSGNFKQAADYLKLLEEMAATPQEKESLLSDRLSLCLHWPNLDMATDILSTFLSSSDLGEDSAMAKAIDGYLKEPPARADPNGLLERLAGIKIKDPATRPVWRQLLARWSKALVLRDRKAGEDEGSGY
jgi:HEAT repeat protein